MRTIFTVIKGLFLQIYFYILLCDINVQKIKHLMFLIYNPFSYVVDLFRYMQQLEAIFNNPDYTKLLYNSDIYICVQSTDKKKSKTYPYRALGYIPLEQSKFYKTGLFSQNNLKIILEEHGLFDIKNEFVIVGPSVENLKHYIPSIKSKVIAIILYLGLLSNVILRTAEEKSTLLIEWIFIIYLAPILYCTWVKRNQPLVKEGVCFTLMNIEKVTTEYLETNQMNIFFHRQTNLLENEYTHKYLNLPFNPIFNSRKYSKVAAFFLCLYLTGIVFYTVVNNSQVDIAIAVFTIFWLTVSMLVFSYKIFVNIFKYDTSNYRDQEKDNDLETFDSIWQICVYMFRILFFYGPVLCILSLSVFLFLNNTKYQQETPLETLNFI